mgnify:CR=1 FL=1
MALWLAIILIAVALMGGVLLGAYIARRQFTKEIAEYPRLTPDAIREMGQKPNEAKVQQTYRNIIKQSKAQANKKK